MKFYVVDQWGQYINEFEDREDAERFCDKWNKVLRFNEWSEPKAHIVEGGIIPFFFFLLFWMFNI